MTETSNIKIKPTTPNKSASETLQFKKLSADKLATIGQALKLSDIQIHELSLILQHIEDDLTFASSVMDKIPSRRTLTRRLKNLEKIIHLLKDELRRGEKDLEHFLPHDVGSFVGKAMSLSAINKALGQENFPVHVDLAISTAVANGQAIDQKQIEILQEKKRESIGLEQPGKLLKYLINGIYEPLRLWVDLDRQNKGGRSPDMRRRFIIYWLAYYSPEILGKAAPAAITGRFVRLCEKIFLANELPVGGLEKVIPSLVKKAHADRKVREESQADQMARLKVLIL